MPEIKFHNSINTIDHKSWNSMIPKNQYPFLKYEFLELLEKTQCVGEGTGWYPAHITIEESSNILGAMPLYIKTDSSGEFVFDYSWANAFYHHGLDYYPKLVTSIPFTPASGPRILVKSKDKKQEIFNLILTGIEKLSQENKISSWHILFPDKEELDSYKDNLSIRKNAQFIWFNDNYKSFDDFLEKFRSRHRKNLLKERQKIEDQKIQIKCYSDQELSCDLMSKFYEFYLSTQYKRSGHSGYMTKDFFLTCVDIIKENIVLVIASKEDNEDLVGGSFFFKDKDNLYGRYWGCSEEYDCLHFECCYYQGIEYAIRNNLKRFDPGVQGEHKIKRGFKPSFTYSAHWISDNEFANAIKRFVKDEEKHIENYVKVTSKYLPFKRV